MTGRTPVRTFRLDNERWELLGQWAERNNWSASDAIRELIDQLAVLKMPAEWVVGDGLILQQLKVQTQRANAAAATLARLDAIHWQHPTDRFCQECGHGWPCLTVRVLQGIEP